MNDTPETATASSAAALPHDCGCGRRIQVAPAVALSAPIVCGACGIPFTPASPLRGARAPTGPERDAARRFAAHVFGGGGPRVRAAPVRVAVACDLSEPMNAHTDAVASAAWILTHATTVPGIAARTATLGFTDELHPISQGADVTAPAQVSTLDAWGCAGAAAAAIQALTDALALTEPGPARLLVIISQGAWPDTAHTEASGQVADLLRSGAGVLWIEPVPWARPVPGLPRRTLTDRPWAPLTVDSFARGALEALRLAVHRKTR